jgi:hypothetical protein
MQAVDTVQELWVYLPEEQKLRPLKMGLREGMIQGIAADLLLKPPVLLHFGQSSFITLATLGFWP